MNLDPLYPPIEPFKTGMLDVGDGHQIYWEQSGEPDGTPIVFLHGGPGSGCAPHHRQMFNPSKYCIILFDQRGAGKSIPHASLADNTTAHLAADMEALRAHLGIEAWHVSGGSWGSTLALAYTMEHASHVKSLVMYGIFLCRDEELKDLYGIGGVNSRIYPDVFEDFIGLLPKDKRDEPLQGYWELFQSDNKATRIKAVEQWTRLEKRVSALIVSDETLNEKMSDPDFVLAHSLIENHYFLKNGFIDANDILKKISAKINDKPMHIIQGRYDMVCPFKTAWDLHKACPHSKLHIIDDAGHTAEESKTMSKLIEILDML